MTNHRVIFLFHAFFGIENDRMNDSKHTLTYPYACVHTHMYLDTQSPMLNFLDALLAWRTRGDEGSQMQLLDRVIAHTQLHTHWHLLMRPPSCLAVFGRGRLTSAVMR